MNSPASFVPILLVAIRRRRTTPADARANTPRPAGQITGLEEQDGRLTGVKVTGGDAVTRVVPLDVLLVFFGLSPKLGLILRVVEVHVNQNRTRSSMAKDPHTLRPGNPGLATFQAVTRCRCQLSQGVGASWQNRP